MCGVNYHGERGRFTSGVPVFCHFRVTKARAKVKAKREGRNWYIPVVFLRVSVLFLYVIIPRKKTLKITKLKSSAEVSNYN